MVLNRLVSSSLHYVATHSANGLSGGEKTGSTSFPNASASGSTTDLGALGEARLAERILIAQELHTVSEWDTLLQGFFAVSMQLRATVDHLSADSAAKGQFDSALQSMDRLLEEGRRAVQGLRSPQGNSPTLGHDLAGVPNALGLPSTVGFRVVVEGEQRKLKAGLRNELYRIGREAIFNAYRHSRAKHIEAEIEYRTAQLRIAVRDNGCGIDPQSLERDGHWGLRGMRERAERIGARLRVLSRAALGTEIELCVPGRVAFE
jgi:signal transduction histidine kinase